MLGFMLLMVTLGSCSGGERSGEAVRIAVPPLEQNALLYIAEARNLFAKHGLKVTLKDYDTGVSALNGMLKGEADISESAEFPFVRAVFQKEKILAIACNDKFENDYIVGRKDRGITKISDLKGKRIGVALKTINEFYLGRFLALNDMNMRNVTLVDVAPADYLKAIAGSDVDALIAWQPYIDRVGKEVNGIIVWPAQSSQAAFGLLVSSSTWVTRHTRTVQGLLESLREAEDYVVHHPDKARDIVRKRLNYEDSYVASVWPQHHFTLSLEQTLVIAMKDEAQWMISNNLTGENTIPDFLNYISIDGLKAVKPEAVNIIH